MHLLLLAGWLSYTTSALIDRDAGMSSGSSEDEYKLPRRSRGRQRHYHRRTYSFEDDLSPEYVYQQRTNRRHIHRERPKHIFDDGVYIVPNSFRHRTSRRRHYLYSDAVYVYQPSVQILLRPRYFVESSLENSYSNEDEDRYHPSRRSNSYATPPHDLRRVPVQDLETQQKYSSIPFILNAIGVTEETTSVVPSTVAVDTSRPPTTTATTPITTTALTTTSSAKTTSVRGPTMEIIEIVVTDIPEHLEEHIERMNSSKPSPDHLEGMSADFAAPFISPSTVPVFKNLSDKMFKTDSGLEVGFPTEKIPQDEGSNFVENANATVQPRFVQQTANISEKELTSAITNMPLLSKSNDFETSFPLSTATSRPLFTHQTTSKRSLVDGKITTPPHGNITPGSSSPLGNGPTKLSPNTLTSTTRNPVKNTSVGDVTVYRTSTIKPSLGSTMTTVTSSTAAIFRLPLPLPIIFSSKENQIDHSEIRFAKGNPDRGEDLLEMETTLQVPITTSTTGMPPLSAIKKFEQENIMGGNKNLLFVSTAPITISSNEQTTRPPATTTTKSATRSFPALQNKTVSKNDTSKKTTTIVNHDFNSISSWDSNISTEYIPNHGQHSILTTPSSSIKSSPARTSLFRTNGTTISLNEPLNSSTASSVLSTTPYLTLNANVEDKTNETADPIHEILEIVDKEVPSRQSNAIQRSIVSSTTTSSLTSIIPTTTPTTITTSTGVTVSLLRVLSMSTMLSTPSIAISSTLTSQRLNTNFAVTTASQSFPARPVRTSYFETTTKGLSESVVYEYVDEEVPSAELEAAEDSIHGSSKQFAMPGLPVFKQPQVFKTSTRSWIVRG